MFWAAETEEQMVAETNRRALQTVMEKKEKKKGKKNIVLNQQY